MAEEVEVEVEGRVTAPEVTASRACCISSVEAVESGWVVSITHFETARGEGPLAGKVRGE